MQRTRLGSIAFVVMMACTLDTSGNGGGTGDSSSSGSSTGTSPTTTSAPTTSATSATSTATTEGPTTTMTTTTASTGTDDSSSTTASTGSESSTDPDTSATGSSSETSSSGEPPVDDYPACMADDDCERPYTLCWPPDDFGTPNFCTLECESAGDCPVPSSGTAVPLCEGPPDQDVCVLDCEDGDCPTGMGCVDIFEDGNFMRCTRD